MSNSKIWAVVVLLLCAGLSGAQIVNPTTSIPYALDTGAVNAYVIAPTGLPAALSTGQCVAFKILNAPTGTSTLTVTPYVSKALMKHVTSGVANLAAAGDMETTSVYVACYDGTEWVLQSTASTPYVIGATVVHEFELGNGNNQLTQSTNIVLDATNAFLAKYASVSTTGIGVGGIYASSGAITIGSGTSIASTSLCSTTQCPAGRYRVNVYIDITTACTTTGSYIPWLGYTDDAGAKTGSSTTTYFAMGGGLGVTPATSSAGLTLVPISTTDFLTGSFFLDTTGAATNAQGSINYGTTATACGSGGPMVGKMYFDVMRFE